MRKLLPVIPENDVWLCHSNTSGAIVDIQQQEQHIIVHVSTNSTYINGDNSNDYNHHEKWRKVPDHDIIHHNSCNC